ncbi:6,7-dimethyl-8-ribityllumazine synthase [Candidatus Erwinia haradaeae]|uniref:6,7-dimethyl-8-ribityllumazine synthase n=1 Tax=Candidatus Erwinia haradaeae TaxID=1922217 RepID=A0A451D1Z2_9GAMM|nr:6,7-dimethyl-8-ribityllumazine synthase [Candidatus Erwinia haradaeae]VFP79628.1 6,7-dimethyl-8-ribityllumazine synthase [Candidatus Erwinia haradaeae]
MNLIEATTVAPDARIVLVVARFNKFINEFLLNGAIDTLKRIGQIQDENITVIWVPGAYELPLIVKVLTRIKKYDAIVALGTIIEGNTPHFEFVAGTTSSCLANISIHSDIPVAFGVLTTHNIEEAIERSGSKMGNKGAEAALTALEMINILKDIAVS